MWDLSITQLVQLFLWIGQILLTGKQCRWPAGVEWSLNSYQRLSFCSANLSCLFFITLINERKVSFTVSWSGKIPRHQDQAKSHLSLRLISWHTYPSPLCWNHTLPSYLDLHSLLSYFIISFLVAFLALIIRIIFSLSVKTTTRYLFLCEIPIWTIRFSVV